MFGGFYVWVLFLFPPSKCRLPILKKSKEGLWKSRFTAFSAFLMDAVEKCKEIAYSVNVDLVQTLKISVFSWCLN